MKRAAWSIAVLLVACTGSSNHTKRDVQGSANVKKTPDDAGGRFVRGPALTPSEQLIAWLDKQTRNGEPLLVRLPVILGKTEFGFTLAGTRVGSSKEALEVFLNDAALGIGLEDRARTQCKDAAVCAMWVEGYWRGKQGPDYTFDVMTVREPIAADALAAASFAEVEGESGN